VTTDRPASGRVPVLDRAAWRDAVLVWLGQHVLLVAVTYLTVTLLRIPPDSPAHARWTDLLYPWYGWDGANYAVIATTGYDTLWKASLFPLLPALEHALAPLAGGDPALAGLLLANAAELAAFALFRVLAERELDRETARRGLLYLALFPTALFFAAPYTESLFLLLSVATFLALRRERWWLAGALAAVATLIRSPGILLTLPIAVQGLGALRRSGAWSYSRRDGLALRRNQLNPRQSLGILGALFLPLATLGGYIAYLHQRFGLWNAIAYAQQTGGGRTLDWPWVGFLRVARAFVQFGPDPTRFQPHILLDTTFSLAFIALALVAIRRVALPYALYACACCLQAICTPAHNWLALSGNMRYMLVAFPIFFVLGRWGARRNVELALLLAMVPLLVLFVATFVSRGWVA
jgi:Mannosyltransferase (PIG-V)